MLSSIFVMKMMNFIKNIPATFLMPVSVEVIPVGGAISIAGSRFKIAIIWLNLEEGLRRVDVPCVLIILCT